MRHAPSCLQDRPSPSGTATPQPRFDPAFAEAVAGGYLTARQALERGRREAYVSGLCRRHALAREVAYAVADNRRSLANALRGARGRAAGTGAAARFVAPPAWTIGVLLPLLLVALLAARGSSSAATTTNRTSAPGGATLVTDEGGQVLRVSGPTPGSVLRAYCNSGEAGCRPGATSLIPAPVREGRARLGLFRRASASGEWWTIVIREDAAGNRWVTGDGVTPVAPEPAPPEAYRRGRHKP